MTEQPKTKVIIGTPNVEFGRGFKKRLEVKGLKVLEISTFINDLFEAIELSKEEGTKIDTLILTTNLAQKLNDLRLEHFADSVFTIRERYSDTNIIIFASEKRGHPLLAELVRMGIYNIFLKDDNSQKINISDLIETITKPRTFGDVSDLLEVDPSIRWRKNVSQPGRIDIKVQNNPKEKHSRPEKDENEKDTKVEKPKVKEKPEFNVKLELKAKEVVGVPIDQKLILVGSPFHGAGSTFVALHLAEQIASYGVPVSYVENPFAVPYAYVRYLGQKKKPDYISKLSRFIKDGEHFRKSVDVGESDWIEQNVRMIVKHPIRDPAYDEQMFTEDLIIKFLYFSKAPIVIYDVGSFFHLPVYQELVEYANHVYLTTEPNLPLLTYFQYGKENPFLFLKGISENPKVKWIGNKFSSKLSNESIFEEITPFLTTIPFVDSDVVFKSQIDGNSCFSYKASRKQLRSALDPMIQEILPQQLIKKSKGFGKSIF